MSTSPLFSTSARHQHLGLAILRVITGIIFVAHGYQKLFVFGIAGVQGAFAQMGIPLPTITAPLIGGLEFFGGLALVIGLLTRPIALALAADMLGAIFLFHLPKGFFIPTGYEFVLSLFGASLALALGGAGSASVDEMIAARGSGESGEL